ncbi:DUF397 domain-containing protein [Streptomyces sp. NPDC050617]|uniref:DUF397 domain-containing protein n=1 Tax=Streptomyces sp. NPDC050617 TaxID=3154628 RepID=UPI00344A3BC4
MPGNDWQKSSYCQAGNSCVGIRRNGGMVQIRESSQPDTSITTTPAKLRGLILSVKANRFTHLI